MFDPNSILVGGISLLVVVFGLVNFFKEAFSLTGKPVIVLSAITGAVLFALFEIQALLPPVYAQVYEIIIKSLVGGLAASGYYQYLNERLPKKD